jgi:beta-glucosidase
MNSFLWGVATSAHQIEGYNSNSDWWHWEHAGNIEGGAVSGRATNHWFLFEKDLKLAKDLGLNSYRFSIEWAKIETSPGVWNQEALNWYDRLLDLCIELGLEPMLTLHHFTNPYWFMERGGFTQPDSVDQFLRFTEKVIEMVRGRVVLWCTFNEPMVFTSGAYLGKFMPPAVFAPQLASLVMGNMLRAHVGAYDLIHLKVKNAQVGIAQNLLDFMPDRAWHPLENILTRMIARFYNRSWLDAITGKKQCFGIWRLIPEPAEVRSARVRKTADFIGVNYYTKAYVRWKPKDAHEGTSSDFPIGISFARRKESVSDLGWAIHPKGFRKMLCFAAKYELPIYITENGIADREDRLRADYLKSHLRELELAKEEDGIDIRGYYHWTLTDNFEWIKGFSPRFGLYSVNYDTDERTLRASALVYKNHIARFNNGLND